MALKIYTTSAQEACVVQQQQQQQQQGRQRAGAAATTQDCYSRMARQPRPRRLRQYDADALMKGSFIARTTTIVTTGR